MPSFLLRNLVLCVGAILLFVGLALLAAGGFAHVSASRFRETAQPATAVITDIVTTRSGGRSGGTSHDVYVRYEVAGKQYNEKLPAHWSGMREGQEVEILYNPDNPSEIDSKNGGRVLALIFLGVGAVLALLGGFLTRRELKKRLRIRRLLASGRAVHADVLGIYEDDSITLKSRGRKTHPYRILCAWTNPDDGERREFESDPVWQHPGALASVTVYVNPADLREYHVSTKPASVRVPA